MHKAKPNKEVIHRIGEILRVTRKHIGLNQTAVAPQLGLDQSALSRVESGKQMLTASQWIAFCHLAGISPESADLGYIELNRPESAVRLPLRYGFEKHSKVRSLIPMLDFAKATLGERGYAAFLESADLDEDFFINLNAAINFNFVLDLSETLIKKTSMAPRDAANIARTASLPTSHGSVHYFLDYLASDPLELISGFVKHSDKYNGNFRYEVVDSTKISVDVSVTPLAHMKAFAHENLSALADFLGHYELGYFLNLGSYGGNSPLKGSILENHFKGARRSLYRLKTVA